MRAHLSLLLTLLLAISLTACGGNNDTPHANNTSGAPMDMGAPDEGVIDMGVDMPEEVDEGPPPLMCGGGELACDESCIDPMTDIDHCGECGNACGRSTACLDGECICFMTGRSWCGPGKCLDLQNDAKNCGECGNKCPAANYCDRGECIDDGFVGEVVVLTNEARKVARMCGETSHDSAGPLSVNEHLAEAAQRHAEDMDERDFFEHDNPDGETPTDRMRRAGYTGSRTGENIAVGQRDPAAVVQAWVDSPGHCRNLMNPNFTEIGVGYHNGNRKQWVQNFGSP